MKLSIHILALGSLIATAIGNFQLAAKIPPEHSARSVSQTIVPNAESDQDGCRGGPWHVRSM